MMGVGAELKMSSTEEGSPFRRVIRESSAAIDLDFEDAGERVKARI